MAEPSITLRAVHDSRGDNLPATRYVVHCTAGGLGYPRESAPGRARGTALYFQKQAAGGSAHYVHDAGGAEEHCVPDSVIAWHAPPNPHSIGDEICGEASYTRDQWLSDEVWPAVRASALRCREVCDRLGIPKVKLTAADLRAGRHGICGHVDVSDAFHESVHWDPGPGFPWDRYMAVVNSQPESEEDEMNAAQQELLERTFNLVSSLPASVWDHEVKKGLKEPSDTAQVLVDARLIARRAEAAALRVEGKLDALAARLDALGGPPPAA